MMSADFEPVILALGWALIHLLWQAALVATILAAALRLGRRSSSNVRYLVSCAALLVTILIPIATLIRSGEISRGSVVSSAALTGPARIEPAPIAAESLVDRVVISTSLLGQWANEIRPLLPWIVLAWGLGVLLFSGRLIIGWSKAQRLRRDGLAPTSPIWQRAVVRISHRLGLSRTIEIFESSLIEVPSVIGLIKPVILIPASALGGLSPEQLEMILAHELAHVRRHDFAANLMQTVAETVLFYHPAVWWISRQIRIERENCCDDLAIGVCGDAVSYARALTRLEEIRADLPELAVASSGGSLLMRIRRIVMKSDRDSFSHRRWVAGLALFVLLTAIALAAPIAAKQSKRAEAATPPAPKVSSTALTVVAEPASDEDEETASDEESEKGSDDPDFEDLFVEVVVPDTPEPPEIAMIHIGGALVPRRPPSIPVTAPIPPIGAPDFDFNFDFDYEYEYEFETAGSSESKKKIVNLDDLSVDDLIALRQHDIDAKYIRELESLGFKDLTLSQLVGMRSVGVTTAFVREMREILGNELSAKSLISLRSIGVDTEYAREMRKIFGEKLTSKELTSLRSVGVDTEYVAQMHQLFGGTLTVKDTVSLRSVGVDPEFARSMKAAGFTPTRKQLTSLRAIGVTSEYVRDMRSLFKEPIALEGIIELRSLGVDVKDVRDLAEAGYSNLTAREISGLVAVGASADYVREMVKAGYSNLSAKELQNLRAIGVDADYVREMNQAGLKNLSASQIRQLRTSGVTASYLKELAAEGFVNLSVDDLIRLRNSGIDAEYLREMKGLRKK